ncbi:hypothetical protein N7U49_36140 [Streptomyces sp. AD2-2]|nr:hypothetical protein N7U49_36140 [Streptomyces sp. AD2-2]
MARGRRRHGAVPERPRRRWWFAAVAALATAATVLIAYGAWTPSGAAGTHAAAHQDADTATRPSASRSTSPSPSLSPSPSSGRRVANSPSPKAKAKAPKRSTRKPATASDAPARQPTTAPAGKRLITIVNRTPKTVWAIVTDTALYPAGRQLAPGQSVSVTVANNWGGRIWGRTGCASTAAGHCATGDCTSVCEGANPPTTLGSSRSTRMPGWTSTT